MKQTFEVLNVQHEDCANTIINSLKDEFGQVIVDLDVYPRQITLNIEDSKIKNLILKLKELGYPIININSNNEDVNLYFQAWKKYFVFDGRATRSEYWQFILINIVIGFLLSLLAIALKLEISSNGHSILTELFAISIIIPTISVSVRRIHDIGLSGWWGFIFIPIGFLMLIVGLIPTKKDSSNVSIVKAVYNHGKDISNEIKSDIENYKVKHSLTIEEKNKILHEDEIYEQIMLEIELNQKVKSAWAKALAQSKGNKDKAESMYINIRFNTLAK